MGKHQTIALTLAALLVSSCATTYAPDGATGGYTDRKLGKDAYSVGFSGNGYTSSDEAYTFFLTRAAELALKNGYSSFYVLDVQNATSLSQYTIPGWATSTTTGNVTGTYNSIGNFGYLNGNVSTTTTTTYSPPVTVPVTKPAFIGRIQLVNEALPNQPEPYDAQTVFDTGNALNAKVGRYNTVVSALIIGATVVVLIASAGSGSSSTSSY